MPSRTTRFLSLPLRLWRRAWRRTLELLWDLPDRWSLPVLSRIASFGHASIAYGFSDDARLYFVDDHLTGRRTYVADRRRLPLYWDGLDARLHWLRSDYCLLDLELGPDDVVIDCGANNGEIGLWVEGKGATYVAFEPDPTAHRALTANVSSESCFTVALAEDRSTRTLFLAPGTADSSLVEPTTPTATHMEVESEALDAVTEELGLSEIRLLKIEAEGYEPEVLSGATETLRRTQFVAVDAGPERRGQNTVSECLNILYAAGFETRAANLVRGSFLLERRYTP